MRWCAYPCTFEYIQGYAKLHLVYIWIYIQEYAKLHIPTCSQNTHGHSHIIYVCTTYIMCTFMDMRLCVFVCSLKRTLFYLYFLFTYTSFIFHTETHIVIHVCTFMDVRNMRIRMCISVYIWIYSRICETAYSVYLNIYSTCVFACSRKRTLIYIYTSLIHIHIFFFTLKHISLYTHMLYRCRDREIEGKI